MKRISQLLIILLLFLNTSLSTAGAGDLKKVSFVPQWLPQAQFAGYYVACERGIYRRYGIDLTIIKGGHDRPSSDLLENGQADFATMWLSSGIQKRSRGVRLVNIAQIMQRSGLMLIAKKSRGIKKPQDVNGKRVGLWGPIFQVQPKAFFKRYHLKVKIITQSSPINLFLEDGVDVASAMLYNEYHLILNSGIDPDELTTFFFYDYGLNFPEDGIYTSEDTLRKDPALCRAFVEASIKGWRYAFAHEKETVDILLKYRKKARLPANRAHQMWMLERMKDLILPDDTPVLTGTLREKDYDRVARELRKSGLIKRIPNFKYFYLRCSGDDKKQRNCL